MNFFQELLSNQLLITAVVSWIAAQIIKTAIDFALNRSFSPERMIGSGGMPSSHSATVSALAAAAALRFGFGSFQFAICFILAAVVMYDATGVRRETGKQARLLNMILEEDIFKLSEHEFQEKLKEFVGHTPLQVFVGMILGIIVALLVNLAY